MTYLSVIIIAYNRIKYLKAAVDSVLNQTLSKENYEIIVVKNFVWDGDEYLLRNNVKVLYSDEQSIGPKIAMAIQNSKGDVILFLDDDDRFLPNKLKHVYDTFDQNKILGYYRNNFEIIDSEGKVRKSNFFRNSINKINQASSIYIKNDEKIYKLRLMKRFSFEALPSCISVRTDILLNNIKHMIHLDLSQDWFSFFAALFSPYSMLEDSIILTQYRIHYDNTSVSSSLDSMAQFHFRLLKSLKVIKEMVESYHEGEVVNNVEKMIQYHQCKYNALGGNQKCMIKELLLIEMKSLEWHEGEISKYLGYFFLIFLILVNPRIYGTRFREIFLQALEKEYSFTL